MKVPDLFVGKRLFVGEGRPIALGVGPTEARGSAFIEGPAIIGDPSVFPFNYATLMVGPNKNTEAITPLVPGALCSGIHNPYSLAVDGDAAIFDNLDVSQNIGAGANIIAQGEVMSRCGGHILSAKKNFDIPHPIKEGWRLRHTCPEGPSNDVYFRGKLKGSNEIKIPDYWKNLVDHETITVSITPIGNHQTIIVQDILEDKIVLNIKEDIDINCFYHVFGERCDGEKLIPEYPGNTPEDYPGNNDEYSVSGFHYDIKE